MNRQGHWWPAAPIVTVVAQTPWYASAHPELAATIAALALARSKSPPAASVLKNCWKKPAGGDDPRSLA